ncbi:hypothetical protein BTJ40_12195 [Microbulbifer sp. A4B17]|uniref:hypothetical protein n=1 Tax=Microbulbifer sp. A4B17 TaxID=359370 RepID=UPI000D52D8EB|nr:hypothetical protein [Microbulbifer sp. A4B17]AWF81521.1 hypothetical protein BTJ40_12195 [Microbulbifer sp. A4B17]
MAFIELQAEIQAYLDTIHMTADTADPKIKDILIAQANHLGGAVNCLVDELNTLTEKQEQLRALLG